jgi:hypothetical protein
MTRVPGTYSGPRARIWNGPIPGTHEPGFVEQQLVEIDVPRGVHELIGGGHHELHALRMGDCNLLLGREPAGVNGELRWHLTISCLDRHPAWDEVKTARYRLLGPDTVVAMILPPAELYVNVPAQDHVFQLWEIDDPARIWESM